MMIPVSLMFGLKIVKLYKDANDSHNQTASIITAETAKSFRKLVVLDLKFIIGSDCKWNFED